MNASAASMPSAFGTAAGRPRRRGRAATRGTSHRRSRDRPPPSAPRPRAEHEPRVRQVAADETGDEGDRVGDAVVGDEQQEQIDDVARRRVGGADDEEAGELHDDARAARGAQRRDEPQERLVVPDVIARDRTRATRRRAARRRGCSRTGRPRSSAAGRRRRPDWSSRNSCRLRPSSAITRQLPRTQTRNWWHLRCACWPRTSRPGTPWTMKKRFTLNGRNASISPATSLPRRSSTAASCSTKTPRTRLFPPRAASVRVAGVGRGRPGVAVAHDPRRIAGDDRVRRHRGDDHRAGADHRAAADR